MSKTKDSKVTTQVPKAKLFNTDFGIEIKRGLSPLFSKARVVVMHTGQNPNLSYFDKWVIEDAISTMKNIPIVGYFMEEEENFGDHEMELAVKDNEIVYTTKTVPIGVIPEGAEFTWETITDKDGIAREYLVVTNALIWNRDDKMVNALKADDFGQSMEIVIEQSYNNNGVDYVDKFYFTALCVLGIDKNGAGYVQPAFNDAKIQTYAQDDSVLSEDIKEMFKDFKFALNEIQNVKKEETELKLEELLAKFSLTEDELSAKVENYSELSVEEVAQKLEEYAKADKAKAKAKDEGAGSDGKDAGKDKGKDAGKATDPAIAKLEKQIEDLKAENEKLKAEIKDLKGQKAKFEMDNHVRECNEKVASFTAQYGLSDEATSGLEFSAFENVDQLETKLFELLGREAKPADTKTTQKSFSKINFEKTENNNTSKYGFAELFD
nr:MAG TPA: Dynein light chain 2, General display, Leucine zipper, Hub.9A [Caudoviricetes sp.]